MEIFGIPLQAMLSQLLLGFLRSHSFMRAPATTLPGVPAGKVAVVWLSQSRTSTDSPEAVGWGEAPEGPGVEAPACAPGWSGEGDDDPQAAATAATPQASIAKRVRRN